MSNSILTISRNILMPALSLLRGGVERRNTHPILGNLLAESDGKTLMLTASNLEISITARIEVIGDVFSTTIPANKFYDIVRLQPDDASIRLAVTKSTVTLSCGNGRYRLQCLPAKDFPLIEGLSNPVTWSVAESSIFRVLADVDSAMGDRDVRYYLNGTLLEIGNKRMQAVSTNGHCLYVSSAIIDTDSTELKQILPRQVVLLLTRVLTDSDTPVQMSLSGAYFELCRDNITIRTRLIDGRYPDYNKVIPTNSPLHAEVDREAFCASLRRAAIVADDRNSGVRLSFGQNAVNISASNDTESSEETFALDYAGEPFEIGVNSSYLLDALGTLPDNTVELSMRDDMSPIVITGKGRREPLFIVMPCRV